MNLNKLSPQALFNLQTILTPRMSKYVPHIPTAKQTAFLLLPNREAFYGGAAGGGKDIREDHLILSHKGWKTVGTLELTDKILALDGSWTDIEYITNSRTPDVCYKLTFSNGEEIIASDTHLWQVTRKKVINRNHIHHIVLDELVCTTSQIVADGIHYKANNKMQKRYMLPQHYGYLGTHQELLIHPYLLGLWLGDGNSRSGEVAVADEDVLYTIEKLHSLHYVGSVKQSQGCQIVRIESLYTLLKNLKLINNKHIPLQYKLASREQRVMLLQGLMDSDGYCQDRGRCEWSQKVDRQELFDDVCELIASLGYKYSKTVAPSTYNEERFPSNRVTFTPREYVATLPRKVKNMFDDKLKNFDSAVYIDKIEQVENCLMKCIRIKHPSHTFLIGKTFIPTHNSEALLMGALQYADCSDYSAILFRRTYADLTLPEALLDRAREWLTPWRDAGEVRWSEKEKTYFFDSGATVSFGYLEHATDKFRYQGAAFQYIAFDELTQIDQMSYQYLFSRLRRSSSSDIPLRMRAASNPGGAGHEWVKDRFIIEGPEKGRIFIPATLHDNPFLDEVEYRKSLDELDPVTRAQLLEGDWEKRHGGTMFRRDWFNIIGYTPEGMRKVRYWDIAGSEVKEGKDPDWSVGLLLGEKNGLYCVIDVIRVRRTPYEIERLIKMTAQLDGWETGIYMEQEPGSASIHLIDHYARNVLNGYAFRPSKITGSKVARANPISAAAEAGRISVVKANWNRLFLDELELFPNPNVKDDQVDCLSGGHYEMRMFASLSNLPIEVGVTETSYWKQFSMN